MCGAPECSEPEDGIRTLKAGIIDCCELTNIDPLHEKYVLQTAEPITSPELDLFNPHWAAVPSFSLQSRP